MNKHNIFENHLHLIKCACIVLLTVLLLPFSFALEGFSSPQASVSVSDSLVVSDTAVYSVGFVSDDGVSWDQFSFDGVVRGNWVMGEATSSVRTDGKYYAIYSCSWNSFWSCSDNWQVAELDSVTDSPQETLYLNSSQGDLQALKDIYYATAGNTWLNTQENDRPWNMNASTLPAGEEWFGVATEVIDGQRRVVHLDLQRGTHTITSSNSIPSTYGNNLTNAEHNEESWELISGHEFPESIGNLQELKYLNIKHNALRGPIPQGITNLVSAKRILLAGHPREPQYGAGSNAPGNHPSATGTPSSQGVSKAAQALNFFEGPIPAGIGALQDLEIFELAFSGVSGSIPQEFGDLSQLRMLILHGNNLSGQIPANLGNAYQLRYFYAHGNELSGQIPAELGNLSDMKHLRLSNNHFSGVIPSELGNIHGLRTIFLSNNYFDEQPFPDFLLPAQGHNELLDLLHVDNTNISGALPDIDVSVIGESRFNVFGVSNNNLQGPIPEWITQHNFIILTMNNNRFSGELPSGFFDNNAPIYTRLRNLYLYRNDLTGPLPNVDFGPMIRNIFLYENDFTGSIPAAWGNIETAGRGTGLSVRIEDNRLSGYIPPQVANITMISPGKLLTFDISANQFTQEDTQDFTHALLTNHPEVDFID